ncbi:uncharacterized acetyltransferase At3g50280 [Brachypodium distachyon]|uniref:Acetyltransferase n=1 Tax=Brachypodium distachyon TaxID=15368 RepID=A0A2K2D236_BRADI|nr:uncharacterized acetyltransferase At3g50280 [Brachypodium distachyon]PNT68340.1 hypothetical protein BRADI_3g39140v3 [Brachypodium distachyon]|eukprot:XP_014756358.2 uncharacterized acetyltransferase At3g50280 [Brachypodium distachyon]
MSLFVERERERGMDGRSTPSAMVRIVSRRTVKPPARPRERIPLTTWDVAMFSANYIQKGLLFPPPAAALSTADLVQRLAAVLAATLADYYPVAGRFVTDKHLDGDGAVVGCSVSVDCGGQGVEIVHAVADGVSVADVPAVVQSLFPLDGAVNYDGHDLPLFVAQVTELADGAVVLGFASNHALSDGTAFWNFLNAWAEVARSGSRSSHVSSRRRPMFERWSPDGGPAAPFVLPCVDVAELIERPPPPPLCDLMVHFSADSLAELKERARQELLAAGDAAGAAALTRFQALTSLLWRCITRARRLAPEKQTVCNAACDNRGRLRPALPAEYFGNVVCSVSTEPARAKELLARGGHGWAAAAVGRAVAAQTDAAARALAAAWAEKPVMYNMGWFDPCATLMGSSPRFDMYGCDFGLGKPLAVQSGRANKVDGKTSLYPGREGGGSMDAEVTLAPDHMAALQLDQEFWAAVSPSPEGKA